jgi:hypothetical protein
MREAPPWAGITRCPGSNGASLQRERAMHPCIDFWPAAFERRGDLDSDGESPRGAIDQINQNPPCPPCENFSIRLTSSAQW